MRSFALAEPESPRMSLTLDAVENNRLSPSLRRGAREGDFRDLCILTSTAKGGSHGSFVSTHTIESLSERILEYNDRIGPWRSDDIRKSSC